MYKDVIGGAVSLIIALLYTIFAFQIPDSNYSSDVIQPNFFPILIGFAWVLTSLILIIKGYMSVQKIKREQLKEQSELDGGKNNQPESEEEELDPKKVTIIFGMILAYVLLFFPLGYFLSTFLFIFGLSFYLERKKWLRNLIIAIVFPLIVYFLFNNVLSVYLPTGPF